MKKKVYEKPSFTEVKLNLQYQLLSGSETAIHGSKFTQYDDENGLDTTWE